MAVSVRAFAAGNVTNFTTATTAMSAAKPSGLAVGDVWLIHHIRRSANAETGVPAGFSVLGPTHVISSAVHRIYYKVADSADVAGGAKTWTQSTSNVSQTVSVAIAGADVAGTIFDAESPVDAVDAASPYSTAGLTPGVAGVLMVLYANATVSNTWTPPTTQGGGWTEYNDSMVDGGAAASRASSGISYKAMPAGGATGAISVVGSVTNQSTGIRAIHINEAGVSTTRVTSDVDLRWRVAARVTDDVDLRWRVAARVTDDVDLRWAVAQRVTDDVDLRWQVAAPVTTKTSLVRLTFPSPPSNLITGPDLQEFRVEMRKVGSGTPQPDFTARLLENGVQRGPNLATNRNVTSAHQVESLLWDASLLSDVSGAGVELEISTVGDATRWCEVVDVEWNANSELTTTQRVSKDLDLRWLVAERVSAQTDLRWQTLSRVAPKDVDLRWQTLSRVAPKDADLRWRVYSRVAPKDADLRWRVYSRVAPKDADLRWRVYSRVAPKDADLRWKVSARVTDDVDLRWQVAAPTGKVSKDLDLRWRTYSRITPKDIDLRWQTLARVPAKDADLRWRVAQRVTDDVDLRWQVAAPTGRVTKDLDLRWQVYRRIVAPKDLDLRWQVYRRIVAPKDADLRWQVLQTVTDDVDLRWRTVAAKNNDVRLTFTQPLANLVPGVDLQEFRVELRKVGSGTPHPNFTARLYENGVQVGSNLVTARNVTANSQVETLLWDASTLTDISGVNVELRISTAGDSDRWAEVVDVEWNANHELTPYTRINKDLDLRWATSGRVYSVADLRWQTLSRVAPQSVDLRWRVAARVTDDVDLRWRVATRITDDVDLRWRVYQRAAPKDIDLRWAVLPATTQRVTKDIDLRWKASGRVSKDLDLQWQVAQRVSSTVDLRWRVLVGIPVAKSLDLRWRVYTTVLKDLNLKWSTLSTIFEVGVAVEVLPKPQAAIQVAPKVGVAWDSEGQPAVEVVHQKIGVAVEVLPKIQASVEVADKLQILWEQPGKPEVDITQPGKPHAAVEVLNV